MSINKIEYGSLASSELLNQNFDFLINELYLTNEYINSINSTLLTNLSSLNSNFSSQIQSNKENFDTSLAEMTQHLEAVQKMSAVDSYTNGSSGYRIYSDGYCEQWGRYSGGSATKINFLKPFESVQNISFSSFQGSDNSRICATALNELTTSYFKATTINTNGGGSSVQYTATYWKACGYLPEGEY